MPRKELAMKADEAILDRMKLFLDYSVRKQQVITSNLANSETPGYKAKELNFDDVFRQELQDSVTLKKTREKHLEGRPLLVRSAEVEEKANDTLGRDGNNVDLDREMTQLAQNVLKFSVVSRLYQQKIQLIKYSLREGRL
jgi:flagellar basal-body rod protein FlgB